MDFLQLTGKSILIFGVANRKSVAWHISRVLCEAGAKCVYVVQNDEVRDNVAKLLGSSAPGQAPGTQGVPAGPCHAEHRGEEVFVCDVEHEEQIARLRDELVRRGEKFHGLVHSHRLCRLFRKARSRSTRRRRRPFCRPSISPAIR